MSSYGVDEDGSWYVAANSAHIKSPVDQVTAYKDNFYNLHIDQLLAKKIDNENYYAIVSCAVYFHCATFSSAQSLCGDAGYTELLGNDSLTASNLNAILSRHWLNRQSRYFDEGLYQSFKRYLQPPLHVLTHGMEIGYTTKQKELIESRPVEQKVRGVAGSGKTKVLAKRAVNAHLRTNERVLILTFNIHSEIISMIELVKSEKITLGRISISCTITNFLSLKRIITA